MTARAKPATDVRRLVAADLEKVTQAARLADPFCPECGGILVRAKLAAVPVGSRAVDYVPPIDVLVCQYCAGVFTEAPAA